jgi:hypothetical protein
MTRFTPLWQQAGSYSAQVDRGLLSALWPTPAAVGAIAAPVSNTMNVSIPPGTIAVPLQAGQNTALCRWDANEVVTSTAAPAAGNTRIDVVILQVRDPQLDAGVNNDFIFQVLAGAPSTGTPVAPTVPNNAAPVCSYVVPAAVANLNGVAITDLRRGIGFAPVFASTTERDALWPTPPDGATCQAPAGVNFYRMGGAWQRDWTIIATGGFTHSGASGMGVGTYDLGATFLGPYPFMVAVNCWATVPFGFAGGEVHGHGEIFRFSDNQTYAAGAGSTTAPGGQWSAYPIIWSWNVPIGLGAGFKTRFVVDYIASGGAWANASGIYTISRI